MPREATFPFDYSLPPVYLAVPGTTIITDQHNTPLEDIQATFNEVQPINFGGTGGSDAPSARLALGVPTYVSSTTEMAALNSAKALSVVLNANLIGGPFELVTLASLSATEQAAVAIDNAAKRILYIVPSDDPTKVYKRSAFTGVISIYWAGAKADGTTHDAALINACITLANALGTPSAAACVQLGYGTSIVEFTTTSFTNSFGVFLLPNVWLRGYGRSSILKSAGPTTGTVVGNGANASVVTDNIRISDFLVDGNQSSIPSPLAAQFSVWIYNATKVRAEHIHSIHAPSWNIRLELITGLNFADLNVVSDSGLAGTDCIHMLDCVNVNGDGIYAYSTGDDALAIDGNSIDIHDINITNIIAYAPSVSLAPANCIVMRATGGNHSATNINFSGSTNNAKGSGLLLSGLSGHTLTVDNCNFNITDKGSASHLNIAAAVISRECEYNIKGQTPTSTPITMNTSVGSGFSYNKLRAQIYNPPDGADSVVLAGTRWNADIQIDYNPLGTKVSPLFGLDCYADHSVINVIVDGAQDNIVLRSGAIHNVINVPSSTGATSADLLILSGANNNNFTCGTLATGISDSGTGNKYYGGQSVEGYGTFSGTTDGSGNLNIPHGLIGTPTGHTVGLVGSTNVVNLTSANGTNLVVHVFNPSTLAAVTATGVTVSWQASI